MTRPIEKLGKKWNLDWNNHLHGLIGLICNTYKTFHPNFSVTEIMNRYKPDITINYKNPKSELASEIDINRFNSGHGLSTQKDRIQNCLICTVGDC